MNRILTALNIVRYKDGSMSKSQSILAKDEIALLGYISVFYFEGYP